MARNRDISHRRALRNFSSSLLPLFRLVRAKFKSSEHKLQDSVLNNVNETAPDTERVGF